MPPAAWSRTTLLLTIPPRVDRHPHPPVRDRRSGADYGQVDLDGGGSPRTAGQDTQPILLRLPVELGWTVVSMLSPVDQVCLALACKELARIVLSHSCDPSDHSASARRIAHLIHRPLLLRTLSRGWFDAARWRYCRRCGKILPRDPAFFQAQLAAKFSPDSHAGCAVQRQLRKYIDEPERRPSGIDAWCLADLVEPQTVAYWRCWCSFAYRPAGDVAARGRQQPYALSWRVEKCPLCVEADSNQGSAPPAFALPFLYWPCPLSYAFLWLLSQLLLAGSRSVYFVVRVLITVGQTLVAAGGSSYPSM